MGKMNHHVWNRKNRPKFWHLPTVESIKERVLAAKKIQEDFRYDEGHIKEMYRKADNRDVSKLGNLTTTRMRLRHMMGIHTRDGNHAEAERLRIRLREIEREAEQRRNAY